MGFNYFGCFPCVVREKIDNTELLSLIKKRDRMNTILALMRKDPTVDKSIPESEWSFGIKEGNQGIKKEYIGTLLKETEILYEYEEICKNCPYNRRSTSFGCGGTIRYPITKVLEKWIVKQLPHRLDSRAGKLLLRAIEDFNYDGAPIDKERQNSALFSSNTPSKRKWGGFIKPKTIISSSQILQMFMSAGTYLNPTHSMLITYFLGLTDDKFTPIPQIISKLSKNAQQSVLDFLGFLEIAMLVHQEKVDLFTDA